MRRKHVDARHTIDLAAPGGTEVGHESRPSREVPRGLRLSTLDGSAAGADIANPARRYRPRPRCRQDTWRGAPANHGSTLGRALPATGANASRRPTDPDAEGPSPERRVSTAPSTPPAAPSCSAPTGDAGRHTDDDCHRRIVSDAAPRSPHRNHKRIPCSSLTAPSLNGFCERVLLPTFDGIRPN